MQSSTSTIIIIVIAGILLFMVPLVTLTGRMDNVAQENVKQIVEEFVTDVSNTGKLTRAKYQNLEDKLNATGNVYDIEMQIYVLDENPGKKTAQANYTKIGENVYLVEYDTQILPMIGIKTGNESVDSSNNKILLKEGDIIFVEAKSTNSTANQTMKSSLIGFSNAGENAISTSSSAMVTVNGENE